jgi:hypothetical protein
MTKARIIPSFLLVFMIMTLSQACKKNCSSTACAYGHTCVEGNCFCPNGLEGDSCKKYSYLKYVNRTWSVQDNCFGGSGIGNVYFSLANAGSTFQDRMLVSGLGSGGSPIEVDIKASVDDKGYYLAIPSGQTIDGSTTISGHGEYQFVNTGRVIFYFDLDRSGLQSSCTVTLY